MPKDPENIVTMVEALTFGFLVFSGGKNGNIGQSGLAELDISI